VPDKWSAVEAAAFPVNYFTAYFAYWKAGLLPPRGSQNQGVTGTPVLGQAGQGAKVLIHAAAGGVGTAAVEIGSVLGAEMFGTSSSNEKLEKVQRLGLQHGINYALEDYRDKIRELTADEGVDAVFEMLGGEHVTKSVACLKFLGRVVTYGSATGERATLDPRILYEKQTSVHGLWLSPLSLHAEIMEPAWQQLSQWIADGRLHPVVGHTLPLEKAREAFHLLKDRQNFGKVVLNVRS
jgi:NADPH2:quinone reductase